MLRGVKEGDEVKLGGRSRGVESLWTQSEVWNGIPGSTDGKEHESGGQTLSESLKPF